MFEHNAKTVPGGGTKVAVQRRMTRLLLLVLTVSACATRVELRDGSSVHGRVERVSETHVEVSSNDLLIGDDVTPPVRLALEDIVDVRTRGHRLLYGAAAMGGAAVASIGGLVANVAVCDPGDDNRACDITFASALVWNFVFAFHALVLFVRGQRLRRHVLRQLRGSSFSAREWTLRF